MANIGIMPVKALSERQKHHDDPLTSDITVSYGGPNDPPRKTFAHKRVLGHYSGYFKRILSNTPTMKNIYLPDDSKAVEDMLRHIYDLEPVEDMKRTALQDIALWNLAHGFEIPSLITSSEVSIERQLRATVGGTVLFTGVLRGIYGGSRHGGALRGIAVRVCGENLGMLWGCGRFRRVLGEIPEFAVEVLGWVAEGGVGK